MGTESSNRKATEGNDRSDAVVSVRFAADELALLRGLADAQQLPLSTVIRRAALAAWTCQPMIDVRTEMNQGAAASGWAFYDSSSPQFTAGSTMPAASVQMNYQFPSTSAV